MHGLLTRIKNGDMNFWNPHCQQKLTSEQTKFLASKRYACIALCFAIQETGLHHVLLRRFACVVVYRLTLESSRTPDTISQDFFKAGLSYGKSLESLNKDIKAFISAGKRYTTFAKELGGFGALFFLPRHVGHSK